MLESKDNGYRRGSSSNQLQEERLKLDHFGAATVENSASALRIGEAREAAIVIDIRLQDFRCFMWPSKALTPDDPDWVEAQTQYRSSLLRSSYAVGLLLELKKMSFDALIHVITRRTAEASEFC